MESWRIFYVAKKKLPPGKMQSIYRRSSRLVDYWAANPRDCDQTKRNPLDRIRDMLEALDLAGYGDYARAGVDYMAEPLGVRTTDIEPARSDKGTVDGEAADAAVALGHLVFQIREALEDERVTDPERIAIVDAARTARREIEQLLDAALNPPEKEDSG